MIPKLSIIVPIYRVENTIERCVNSLFKQNYDNIEYIFVNDATNDKSVEILEQIIAKNPHKKAICKIIHHSENKGLSAARYSGLLNSTGDYIWHIDSDDAIDPDAVAGIMHIIEKENSDIVLFNACEVWTNEKRLIKNYLPSSIDEETILTLTRQKRFELCFRVIKRNLYTGLEMDQTLSMGEDWATTPRLSAKAKIISYFDKICYYYYRDPKSITGNLGEKGINSLLACYRVLHTFFFKTKYVAYLPVAKAYLKIHMLKMARNSKENYIYISNSIFSHISCPSKYMSFPNRVILLLGNLHLNSISRGYVNLSCNLIKLFQR